MPSSLKTLSIKESTGITAAGLAHLKQLPELITLNIEDCEVGDAGAEVLATLALNSLNVWGNGIGAQGAQHLAANPTINWLNLGFNDIGDEGARFLAANLTIKGLLLQCSGIGDEGAGHLAGNTALNLLSLEDNDDITAAGSTLLTQAQRNRPSDRPLILTLP